MRLHLPISLIFATLLGTAAAVAGDKASCHSSARECTQQIRQMLAGRRYLGVEVVELKPGLVVKTVLPNSPASRVELKAGDRLIAVNGRSLNQSGAREFKQYLAAAGGKGKILLIIQRRGAYRRIEMRLEPYPTEYIDKVITAHLSQSHTATAGAQP